MKPIFKRLARCFGEWSVIGHHEVPSDFQFPVQKNVALAAFACFVSLIGIYGIARTAVERIDVWWLELLIYALIPMTVTFQILYRSNWHREMKQAARACSAFLVSCAILGVSLMAIGISVFVVCFCASSLPMAGGR